MSADIKRTTEELRAAKTALEWTIFMAIKDFEKGTGLRVDRVSLQHTMPIVDPKRTAEVSVEVVL